MFDLTDHQLATIATWADVAIILFMVLEKYGPAWGAGHLTPRLARGGVWWFLWENRTLWVAILGLGFIGWLYLWRGMNPTADTAKITDLTGQATSLKSQLDAKISELDAVQRKLQDAIDLSSGRQKFLFINLA